MRVGEKSVQRHIALALAHLCSPEDQRTIFIDDDGLDLLLELLGSTNLKQQQDASVALYKVYLGEQYVNSSTLSDLTFLVEGKCFYAHRIALLASSDAFCAMFDGVYRCSYRYLPIDNFNLKCLSGCPRYQSKDHVGLGS
nr:PREDICTED: ARM REPEAT PROTEIN INTERACTING WITH ABF2-like [Musa acuminata subsp. malaccensis]